MTGGFTVRGADRLASTARAAARRLADLERTNRQAAGAVRAAASPPRLTGALAASLTVSATATTGEVASSLPYAGVIEHGWPRHGIAASGFLASAFARRQPAAVDLYARAADDAVRSVKGA